MANKRNIKQKKSKKTEKDVKNTPDKCIEPKDRDDTDAYVPMSPEEKAKITRIILLARTRLEEQEEAEKKVKNPSDSQSRQMDLDGMDEEDEKSKKCLGHVSFLLRDNENFQTYEMETENDEKGKRMEDLEKKDRDEKEIKAEKRRQLGVKLWNQYKNAYIGDESDLIDGDVAEVKVEETSELEVKLWNQYKMKQVTYKKCQMVEDSEVIDGEEADVKDEQLPELTIDE